MAESEEYEIFSATTEIELNGPLLRSELYLKWKKNLNLSFHKILKRDSERIPRVNIFRSERFVDKRMTNKLLRKLNIVDDGQEFLVCLLNFRSENYNFSGKFLYTRIFHLIYSIIELCIGCNKGSYLLQNSKIATTCLQLWLDPALQVQCICTMSTKFSVSSVFKTFSIIKVPVIMWGPDVKVLFCRQKAYNSILSFVFTVAPHITIIPELITPWPSIILREEGVAFV